MKQFSSVLLAGLIVFATVQGVNAFDINGGNALWGKYAIQTCRSCHIEKGLTSLDPKERSLEKWEEFFVNDYAKLQEMSHDFAAVGINDRQLENIHKFLIENAARKNSSRVTVAAVTTSTSAASSKKVSSSSSYNKPKAASSKKSSYGSSSSSSSKKFDMNAGNAGKGRYIFRKCLSCHKKTDAPIVSPGDRTKKAWSRFFDRDFRKFKKYMPEFDTYKYSVGQMEHLHQFFLKYALDADKPKTCE